MDAAVPYRGSNCTLHLHLDEAAARGSGDGPEWHQGEDAWRGRKHGRTKQRVRGSARTGGAARSRRRIRLDIDGERGASGSRPADGFLANTEIRAVEVASCNLCDAPMLPNLLAQIPADAESATVTADRAQVRAGTP
nr:hypothetical protein [Poseidonocella sp. HB161398]